MMLSLDPSSSLMSSEDNHPWTYSIARNGKKNCIRNYTPTTSTIFPKIFWLKVSCIHHSFVAGQFAKVLTDIACCQWRICLLRFPLSQQETGNILQRGKYWMEMKPWLWRHFIQMSTKNVVERSVLSLNNSIIFICVPHSQVWAITLKISHFVETLVRSMNREYNFSVIPSHV